jgi:FtsH-binding integral membrane protein
MPTDPLPPRPGAQDPVFEEPPAVRGLPIQSAGTAAVFGRVVLIAAAALGLLALGAFVARDLSRGTGLLCSFGGFSMVVAQHFGGERFRVGRFAINWLFALAAVIGLGLGPVLPDRTDAAVTRAAAATAVIVVAVGVGGFVMAKDLAGWTRPVSSALLALVLVSLVRAVFGSGDSSLLTLAIGGVSAALIVVDLNFRRHRRKDHVVSLATGIFVASLNIFLSLLNLIGHG